MKNFIWIPVIVVGFLLLSKPKKTDKRGSLIAWLNQSSDSLEAKQRGAAAFQQMSELEIDVVYTFIFDYIQKGVKPAPGSSLSNAVSAISAKYGIFT